MAASKTSTHTEKVVGRLGESVASPPYASAEAALSAMVASQQELMDFVQMRLEKDGETIRETLGCKNWADMLRVQLRWAQETLQDYSAETANLLAIYTEHGGEVATKKRQS
jgi:Phasin protein